MTIRKRVGSVLFTAAATAAVVGMSIGPALASTTHLTVKVSHGGSYTAKAGKTTLSANGVAVTCTSSTASGKLASGTHKGKASVSLGGVKGLSFKSCTSIAGTMTTTVHGTPELNADSRTSSKGDTDAIITGVNVSVSTTGCSFKVTGTAPGYYSNKTHTLYMTPKKLPVKPLKTAKLTISGVAPGACLGAISNGDHPTYLASYKISRKIVIHSS